MRDDHWPKFYLERTSIGVGSCGSDVVSEKIECAFGNVKSFPLERIIFQFWQPLKPTPGATVLSCSDTPYAYPPTNHRLRRYRSCCSLYNYGVFGLINDPMIITHAPPAYAFWKKFPEVVLDLSVHKGTPLVDLALECELRCFMMLPLFHETSCVGIIEVSARFPRHLPVMFYELHCELKKVGLSICRPAEISQPLKGWPGGFSLARSEVEKALKAAVESHDITLAQVWFSFINHHDRLRSRLLGKVWTHRLYNNSDVMHLGKHFYDHLVYLPLDNGPVLIARTLETRQPHLCRNIYKFNENKGLMKLLSAAHTRSTCFVICLRSSHTGDLDLVFEFFWPQQHDHLPLMEALILTLSQHLPSFNYDSGAQLGDQLLVVDVENSSSTTVKIFPQNERALVAGMKRKTRASARMERESLMGQSELNQYDQFPLTNINNLKDEEEDDDDDDDDLVMLAIYKVDKRLFFLPTSPTFESLLEKINAEFELNPAVNYEIEYQVLPGEWYSLTDDTCLKSCISSYRASTKINHIKLYVLAVEK